MNRDESNCQQNIVERELEEWHIQTGKEGGRDTGARDEQAQQLAESDGSEHLREEKNKKLLQQKYDLFG